MKSLLLAGILGLMPLCCPAQKVALTFDDLPVNGSLPVGMSEVDLVKRVLPILKAAKAPPSYGFVNARKLEGNRPGAEALRLWVEGGQRVGSHTYSHMDLTTNSVEDFERDVLLNEPALLLLTRDDSWRWLRFPYLHEGDTLEKRHAVRTLLHERGYTIAQTTLDYEDYMWNSAYARCLDKHDAQSIAWLRSSYLATADAWLDMNRAMSRQLYGRDISHVLLLHLGAFSPEILPPLLEMLQQKGFTLVTLEEAQRDPVYQDDPDFAAPNTGTLLEQHFDAKHLQYPAVTAKPRKQVMEICQ
ncbi:MAG TPA: polysaccharide deacetylase family protein [Povalibacter sp.]|nr:polysaccharide deacetylase family protein [Povalibacter sp.]